MTDSATFYHAGCSVCIAAEDKIVDLIDRTKITLDIVHLGEQPERIAEAESAGVVSVPALVYDGSALHINHGADLSALK